MEVMEFEGAGEVLRSAHAETASFPRMLNGVAYGGSLQMTLASREAKAWEWTLKQ